MYLRHVGPAAALVLLIGCGSSTSTPKPATNDPTAPTFSNVWVEVILGNNCQSSQCHSALASGGLQMSGKALAYANLVGVPAAGTCPPDSGVGPDGGPLSPLACSCGTSGLERVVPGDPGDSLIIQKLSGSPSCGERMPPTGDPVSQDELDLVTKWIAAGAKND